MQQPFDLHGPACPSSPVVLSVPHAGREYPLVLRAALRAPVAALAALEDRHVDAVALAARQNETCLVQRLPRAWIDLNRAEHERDPLPCCAEGVNAAANEMAQIGDYIGKKYGGKHRRF